MAESADRPDKGISIGPVPAAIDLKELTPTYANAASVQFSPYEFMLTFLRTEYMLQGAAPDGATPMSIAVRVALSHRAMKELLDAAIDNYRKFMEQDPNALPLKVFEPETDDSSV